MWNSDEKHHSPQLRHKKKKAPKGKKHGDNPPNIKDSRVLEFVILHVPRVARNLKTKWFPFLYRTDKVLISRWQFRFQKVRSSELMPDCSGALEFRRKSHFRSLRWIWRRVLVYLECGIFLQLYDCYQFLDPWRIS